MATRHPHLCLVLLVVAVLALGGPVAAQDDEPGTPPAAEPATEPATESAEPAAATAAAPDPAADLFLSRCAGCHTLGGGVLTGPDLAPAAGWPTEDLAKAVERMEKNAGPMSDEQVDDLVALLQDENVQPRLSAARERQVEEMAATLEPASPRRGQALFYGSEPLRNGGVACFACHRAGDGGGNLAVELTGAAERLGETGLRSAAENPGFPLMKAAYAAHPVTRQEAVHLTAYLMQIAPSRQEAAAGFAEAAGGPVGAWGAGVAVVFLLAMWVLYRGRVRGVRASLVREATRR